MGAKKYVTRIQSTCLRHLGSKQGLDSNPVNLFSAPSGAEQKLDANQVNLFAAPSVVHGWVNLNQDSLFSASRWPKKSSTRIKSARLRPSRWCIGSLESSQSACGLSGAEQEPDLSGAKEELDSNRVNLFAAPSLAIRGIHVRQVNLFAAPRGPNKSLT